MSIAIANDGFGGWFSNTPATGKPSNLVRTSGLKAAYCFALTALGTGNVVSLEQLQQIANPTPHVAHNIGSIRSEAPIRTPSENLVRIREVLKPAISDLASTFGVSRQSIYNWINGEPVAEENAAKLYDLAKAADVLAHEGVEINPTLLKRKLASGRTLMQAAQDGMESAYHAALQLVEIHKHEAIQREKMQARFASRNRTPSTEDFDLPMSN